MRSVKAVNGISRGPVIGEGGQVFRGIPYGTSVSASARFRPSRKADRWGTSQIPAKSAAVAPQLPSRLGMVIGRQQADQDEDCLTVTIWTPPAQAEVCPVLVFFHGGAYVSGGGSLACYDAAGLAARGKMIVVNVNHRLGALGYLVDPDAPSSLALEDQRLAIDWVHENIASFGGDPEQITLMGQSSGAISIVHLLHDSGTARQVRRVILQSGGFGRSPLRLARAAEVRRTFVEILGRGRAGTDEATLLQTAPVADILSAQAETMSRFGGDLVFRPLSPDDADWSGFIQSAAKACDGIDVLICVTAEEGRAFAMEPMTMADAERSITAQAGVDQFVAYRQSHAELSPARLLAQFLTDNIYCGGNLQLARMIAARSGTVYCAVFDGAEEGSPFGSCHCIELPFVFGNFPNWADAAMLRGLNPSRASQLSADIQNNWINFIRGGEPFDADWPRFDAKNLSVRRFGPGARLVDDRLVQSWLAARPLA